MVRVPPSTPESNVPSMRSTMRRLSKTFEATLDSILETCRQHLRASQSPQKIRISSKLHVGSSASGELLCYGVPARVRTRPNPGNVTCKRGSMITRTQSHHQSTPCCSVYWKNSETVSKRRLLGCPSASPSPRPCNQGISANPAVISFSGFSRGKYMAANGHRNKECLDDGGHGFLRDLLPGPGRARRGIVILTNQRQKVNKK
jgi:hypothetical protein